MTTRRDKRKQSEPDDDNGREYPDKRRKQQLSSASASAPSLKESAEERSERIARQLYVNGAGITEKNWPQLLEYLNSIMQTRMLCPPRERSIVGVNIRVQFSASSLLVFACSTYATNALRHLQGRLEFCGSELTFERPHEYHEAPGVAHTDERNARRLHVQGVYITAENRMQLIKYLTIGMRKRNLCGQDDCPIMEIDKRFLVFKSAEMATRALQLDGIDFSGSALTIIRPHAYAGPSEVHVVQSAKEVKDDSCSSVALLEPSTLAISDKAKKTARRLYVKGMVIKKDDRAGFVQFLNQELRDRRLSPGIELPLVSIHDECVVCASPETALHTLSNRCFLVFQSAEMASQALQLNGIDFRGSTLTFERPHAYTGPPDLRITQSAESKKDDSLELSTSAISNNDDKRARRLYVKGMVIKKDDRAGFVQFLNQELRARRLSAGFERPVVSIHDDFIVCASPETALHTLSLTGSRYNNCHLDLHRSNEMACRLKVATRGIKVRVAFKYLNEQMRTRKLCGPSERPIVACLNHSLVFNCAEMASRAYTLNGIDNDGSMLTLERPSEFVGAPATVGTTTTPCVNIASLETVSKLGGEANAQIKGQETTFISDTGEIAQLKLKVEKLERIEHSRVVANEQLVHENGRHKQMNAQLEKAAKTETTRSEELGSKLEKANQRIQRMGEILANSMDELISERRNLRELKVRMETSLQSEKAERQKAERQVEDLKAAAASRLPVPVSPVKHEQGKSQPSVKKEQEWDV